MKRCHSFRGKPSLFSRCAVHLTQGVGDMAIDLLINGVARRANGIFDRQRIGAAMSDDRHAVQTNQRRAAIFRIV